MLSPRDPQLDDYLQRLGRALRLVPSEEREALYQELRQHLDALVAAYVEAGCGPDEAVSLALTRFGDPWRIGRRMAWEHHRRRWQCAYGLVRTLSAAGLWALLFSLGQHLAPNRASLVLYNFVVLPFLAGATVGMCSLGRSGRRTLVSAALFILWFTVVEPGVEFWRGFRARDVSPQVSLSLMALLSVWWLTLGMLATLSASARRRAVARHQSGVSRRA